MAYAFLTALLLGVFWAAPNVAWMQWLIVAGVGFALYVPQMLIGLCGAEVVRKPAVSAAQGFLGWISYLGAAPQAASPIILRSFPRGNPWGGYRARGSHCPSGSATQDVRIFSWDCFLSFRDKRLEDSEGLAMRLLLHHTLPARHLPDP